MSLNVMMSSAELAAVNQEVGAFNRALNAGKATTAGGDPLYGTCTMLTPASWAKSSAARWGGVPAPGLPKFNLPGLPLA